MKNAKLKKLVHIMTLSAFLLLTGIGTASAHGGNSQAATPELQQSKSRITGMVVDRTGEPVIGANIIEKGMASNGTISDVDGRFSLEVAPEATLLVSYVGYTTQEIIVANRTQLQIVLQEDLLALEEVVVVGYGMQKKVSLTGSVATLKSEEIQNIPAGNLTNLLSGRLSGVTIQQSAGGIPGQASSIQIRARSTWNTGVPLFVIDGVVRDKFAFDGLNANEIENLSVLKDASSSSVYGARAANGVVLVTTKRGKSSKPLISYSGTVGYNRPTKIPERETAYEHTIFTNDYNMEHIAYPDIWQTSIYQADGVTPINTNVFTPDEQEYYKTHNYDWLDETWSNPVLTTHALNVSGGNESIRYFAGGSYYNESGGFKSIGYEKYSARTSLDANINRDLVASLMLNTTVRNDQKPVGSINGRDALWYQMLFASHLRPAMIDGKYIGGNPGFNAENIAARANGSDGWHTVKNTEAEITASLSYDVPFIKGLNLKALYNYYTRSEFDKEFGKPYQIYALKYAGANNHIITDEFTDAVTTVRSPGYLNEKYTPAYSYQVNFMANYNRTFGKHELDALFVYEQTESNTEWFSARKNDYQIYTNPYFNAGPSTTGSYVIEGKGSENGRLSYVGRLKYGFDSKYLLDLSFRYDGSAVFQEHWGFFPAVSAAWRISEERFFKEHVSFINYLKLRGSVGLTGNDAVGLYQYMETVSLANGAYFGGMTSGVAPGILSNPLITWEKSMNYEAGIDLGFLENRLLLGAEYFFKHTYDILGSTTNVFPDTFGGTLADENYGIIDSQGVELEWSFNQPLGRDAKVWISGNFGYAVNKVIEMKENAGLLPHLSKVGLNYDREYGYIDDDMIRSMDQVNAILAKNPNFFEGLNLTGKYAPHPGLLLFKDLRGPESDQPNGKIDAGDVDKDWIMTHTEPPFNYGFTLGGSWKGFALEVFFHGLAGHQKRLLVPGQYTLWYEPLHSANWGFWSKDHFSLANPDAQYPAPTNWGGKNNESTFWVRDASFLRLKNVNLSYTVPKTMLSKSRLGSLNVYLNATNLFFLEDHIKEFDAEVERIDIYPLMSAFTMGVNISF